MGVAATPGVAASGLSPYGKWDQANGVIQGTFEDVGPLKALMFWAPMNVWVWGEYVVSLTVTAGTLTAATAAIGPVLVGSAINSTLVPPGTTVGGVSSDDVDLVLPPRTLWGKLILEDGFYKISELIDTDWLLGATVDLTDYLTGATVAAIETVAVPPNQFAPGVKGKVRLSGGSPVIPPENATYPFDFTLSVDGLSAGVDAGAIFTGAAIGATAGIIQLERSFDGGLTFIPCNVGAGALAQFLLTVPLSFSFGEPERNITYRLNVIEITPMSGVTMNYRISATGQAATSVSVPTI